MSHITPESDGNTLLRRADAVAALTAAGYPCTMQMLANMASKGGGPKFKRFGRTPLYRLQDLLDWAERRSTPFGETVSECDAARVAAA